MLIQLELADSDRTLFVNPAHVVCVTDDGGAIGSFATPNCSVWLTGGGMKVVKGRPAEVMAKLFPPPEPVRWPPAPTAPPEAKSYVDLRVAVTLDDRRTQNIRFRIPANAPDAKLQERFDQLLEAAEEAYKLLLNMALEAVAPIDPFHPTLTRLEASIMLAAKPAANRQADAGQ